MMRYLFALVLSLCVIAPLSSSFAFDDVAAKKLIEEKLSVWAHSPEVIEAVKAQNATTASYDQAKIDALDAEDKTLIDPVLASPVSQKLKQVIADSAGDYTEIFIMDAKGLNVAQSDKTSDYWQGDEPKFQKTFGVGPDAVFLDAVEMDESTQTYSQQLSFTLKDGDVAIGAVTIGLNADKVK
jgi:hypothetical protein